MKLIKTLAILMLLTSLTAHAKPKTYQAGVLSDHSHATIIGWRDDVSCVVNEVLPSICSGDWDPISHVTQVTFLTTADGVEHRLSWKTKYWGGNFSPSDLASLSKEGVQVSYRIEGHDAFVLDPTGREIKFGIK